MGLPIVKINTKAGFGTTINIDGKNIEHIRAFSITQEAGEMPILELELYVRKVEIEGESTVKIVEVEAVG